MSPKKSDQTAIIPRQAMVPVEMLLAHPKNYKIHPRSQVERVAASIETHGQRKPVPVRETKDGLIIVAGHCVVQALLLLSKKNLVKYGRCWITYVPDEWDDAMATSYLVADNATGIGSEDDKEILIDLLKTNQSRGFSLESMGFTQSMADDLFASVKTYEPPEVLGRTVDDQLDAFTFGTIRQIVLLFDVDKYASTLEQFTKVREEYHLETNADVVEFLLGYHRDNHGR